VKWRSTEDNMVKKTPALVARSFYAKDHEQNTSGRSPGSGCTK
jgi:hypothetical protein